jgi:hypothetical protein
LIVATGGVTTTCTGLPAGAFGSVCTNTCPSGTYLSGDYQRMCNTWVFKPNCTAVYSTAKPATCVDTRLLAQASSVCELTAPPESCFSCNTLMYESWGYDYFNSSRWTVADSPTITNGPSVWSTLTAYLGTTIATMTNAPVGCGTAASAQASSVCTATSLIYAGGAAWTNYKVRMNFAFASLNGNIGVVLYWTPSGYYEYLLMSTGDRMLRKVVNGVTTNLWAAAVTIAFVANAFQNVEVEVRYGKIRVWNEGVLVGNPVYDSTLTGGSAGPSAGSGATPMVAFVTVQQQSAVSIAPLSQCK